MMNESYYDSLPGIESPCHRSWVSKGRSDLDRRSSAAFWSVENGLVVQRDGDKESSRVFGIVSYHAHVYVVVA